MSRHKEPGLTPRERDMLKLLMDGRPNKQIAEGMGVTIETVKQHQDRCRLKLGVRGRAALAVWAVTHPGELG